MAVGGLRRGAWQRAGDWRRISRLRLRIHWNVFLWRDHRLYETTARRMAPNLRGIAPRIVAIRRPVAPPSNRSGRENDGMTPARDARTRAFRSLLPRELQSRTTSLARRIAAGLRTYGRAAHSSRFLLQAASQTFRFSANGLVRSHLPLRGSSGFTPDSLLGPAFVLDTAIWHNIWCFGSVVNPMQPTRGWHGQSALLLSKKSYIIRAHFRFGLLGTRARPG